MKSFRSKRELSTEIIAVAGLLHLAVLAGGASEFRRCYNTSVEMHCFDLQYDTTNNRWLNTSFDNARQRCNDLQSTLIIIRDEETNNIVQQFMNETTNPVRFQNVWLDAYRLDDFNLTYRWRWLDSTLSNLPASGVIIEDQLWYVASLEFIGRDFHLLAQQPHFANHYVCEYGASKCSAINSSNVRQFDGRCYDAINELVSWYEARNRCLKRGGDLASFANVTSINFTSWLVANATIGYWIGLRFTWYIWKDSGEEDVKFAKWSVNYDDWYSPCLNLCPNCYPRFSWRPQNCSITGSIYVVCHSATTINPTTTSTSTTHTALKSSNESRGSEFPNRLAIIGVGVGVGVGVPVLIAVVVLFICIAIRRRRHQTASSGQSNNRKQRESSFDQPLATPTVGDSAYGTVVPSTFSRETAEANGTNSAKEQTEYASLQIL